MKIGQFFVDVSFLWCDLWEVIMGFDYGLVPNKRQAII